MAGRLSQPGCYTNTGTSARSGRSLVRLEGLLPENNLNRQRGNGRFSMSSMRGSTSKRNIEKSRKTLIGRRSSFLQFGTNPVKYDFKTEKEEVHYAREKFKKMRAVSKSAVQVLARMKEDYPNLLTNNRLHKLQGHVPGIEVGECFESRAELSFLGLHRPIQSGISWKVVKYSGFRVSFAVSIVVSGGYEDDVDEGETLTYTGEGGNSDRTKSQYKNQKLEGGNLAMRNSHFLGKSVRVIRGRPDPHSLSEKLLYSYDGLYKVVDYVKEPGISNFEVYKFTLVREGGQKPLLWQCPVSPRQKIRRGFESPARR